MTLIDLQKVLYDRVEVTLRDMTPEELKRENEKSAIIIGLSKQIVSVQNTIQKAAKMISEDKDSQNIVGKTAFLRDK